MTVGEKIQIKRNIIDRVIEAVSPVTAANRYAARVRIGHARGLYDGASSGRRIRPGLKQTAAPKNEAGSDVKALADRALGLVRNDGYAKRGRNVLQAYTTGTGIRGTIKNSQGVKDLELQKIWDKWCNSLQCDTRRQNNFYGIQRQVWNSMVVTGESLIGRTVNREVTDDPLMVPLSLYVMESSNLDKSKHNDRDIIYGVKFIDSRPTEYYILPDPALAKGDWVKENEIIHIYDDERPGQVRGSSWFAPVILNLQDLGDYRDSERVRRKVAACFTAFLTSTPETDFSDEELNVFSKMEPGAIEVLSPGQEIRFSNPPESRDYDPYVRVETQFIASGLGCTYEHLSQNLKDVNFSSAKIGQIPFRKTVEVWQELLLRPKFLDPVFEWFRDMAVMSGMAGFAEATIEWTYPKFEMLDEAKETDALTAKVRAGFMSQSEAVRSMGYDPEEVLLEWATDYEKLVSLGIRIDTIPEWFTKAGIEQSSQTPTT